jgi:glutathione S-transferase
MITVYVFGNVPAIVRDITRDLRALWVLEESGLPYRVNTIEPALVDLLSVEVFCAERRVSVPLDR